MLDKGRSRARELLIEYVLVAHGCLVDLAYLRRRGPALRHLMLAVVHGRRLVLDGARREHFWRSIATPLSD